MVFVSESLPQQCLIFLSKLVFLIWKLKKMITKILVELGWDPRNNSVAILITVTNIS